jgi:DNA-binding NarL/FixJ family response regulator
VLKLVIQGKSNKEICRELGLSQQTVKNLVAPILEALKKFG